MEVPLSQTNLFSFVYTPRWQHLSQFAPRGLPGPGVPHLVPPGAIAVRTLGPGGGPIFELRIDDVYHVISELICIVTDVNMTNDRQEYPPHRLRWISRGGIVVSNYSNATQAGRLVNNQVRDTCGGNSNYDVAFMLNLPTYNSAGADPRRNLRRVIQRVLHNLYRLLEFPNNNVAWRRRKASIAFPLLGYGPLGYDLGHLADDTLSAITLWFNHPVYGAARKGRIGRIYRLIPAHNHPKLRAIDTKIAWKIAWDNYLNPGPPGFSKDFPGTVSAVRRSEVMRLQATSNGMNVDQCGVPINANLIVPPVLNAPNSNPLGPTLRNVTDIRSGCHVLRNRNVIIRS